ncbi:MAG: Ig-like domain-containing protein, partial [Candidatus Berkiellales bacterium]
MAKEINNDQEPISNRSGVDEVALVSDSSPSPKEPLPADNTAVAPAEHVNAQEDQMILAVAEKPPENSSDQDLNIENLDFTFASIFFPVENALLPHEGLVTAFEDAFFKYLTLDSGEYNQIIQFLASENPILSEPDFLKLSFEELFKVPVTEGSGEVTTVSLAAERSEVDSIGVPLNIGEGENAPEIVSVASEERTLTVLSSNFPPPETTTITNLVPPPPPPPQDIDLAPIGKPDFGTVMDEEEPLSVSAANGLLKNDIPFDPDDKLTVATVNGNAMNVGHQISLPSGALLTVKADGSYTYDPNGHYEIGGTDTFFYQASGNNGAPLSAPVLVTITITGDGAPTAVNDSGTVPDEDKALTVSAAGGLLSNDKTFDQVNGDTNDDT